MRDISGQMAAVKDKSAKPRGKLHGRFLGRLSKGKMHLCFNEMHKEQYSNKESKYTTNYLSP